MENKYYNIRSKNKDDENDDHPVVLNVHEHLVEVTISRCQMEKRNKDRIVYKQVVK